MVVASRPQDTPWGYVYISHSLVYCQAYIPGPLRFTASGHRHYDEKVRLPSFIRYIVPLLLVLLIILLSAGMIWVVSENRKHDMDLARLYALEKSALLMDMLGSGLALDDEDLPEGITGFAIYGREGDSLLRLGTAPEKIDKDYAQTFNYGRYENKLRFVRTFGGRYINMSWNEAGGVESWYALVEYDMTPVFKRLATGNLTIVLSWLAVLIMSGTLFLLSRRIARLNMDRIRNRQLLQLGMASRVISHEIRNPLGSQQIQIDLIRRHTDDPVVEQHLKILEKENGRLLRLTDRVRELLSDPGGEPVPIDLSVWLDQAVMRSPVPFGIGDRQPGLRVRMDPDLLYTVTDNLLRNAWEAMEESDKPDISIIREGRTAVLSVADRGPGIPPGQRHKIFNPFFTTKPLGSGVGLSLSRQIAEAAGGRLELRDRDGGGIEARLLLPLTG